MAMTQYRNFILHQAVDLPQDIDLPTENPEEPFFSETESLFGREYYSTQLST
jgi:hypothetical protein